MSEDLFRVICKFITQFWGPGVYLRTPWKTFSMRPCLELKATQKKYAKQYLNAKSINTADKISFAADTTETIADSANLEIQGEQLK